MKKQKLRINSKFNLLKWLANLTLYNNSHKNNNCKKVVKINKVNDLIKRNLTIM